MKYSTINMIDKFIGSKLFNGKEIALNIFSKNPDKKYGFGCYTIERWAESEWQFYAPEYDHYNKVALYYKLISSYLFRNRTDIDWKTVLFDVLPMVDHFDEDERYYQIIYDNCTRWIKNNREYLVSANIPYELGTIYSVDAFIFEIVVNTLSQDKNEKFPLPLDKIEREFEAAQLDVKLDHKTNLPMHKFYFKDRGGRDSLWILFGILEDSKNIPIQTIYKWSRKYDIDIATRCCIGRSDIPEDLAMYIVSKYVNSLSLGFFYRLPDDILIKYLTESVVPIPMEYIKKLLTNKVIKHEDTYHIGIAALQNRIHEIPLEWFEYIFNLQKNVRGVDISVRLIDKLLNEVFMLIKHNPDIIPIEKYKEWYDKRFENDLYMRAVSYGRNRSDIEPSFLLRCIEPPTYVYKPGYLSIIVLSIPKTSTICLSENSSWWTNKAIVENIIGEEKARDDDGNIYEIGDIVEDVTFSTDFNSVYNKAINR